MVDRRLISESEAPLRNLKLRKDGKYREAGFRPETTDYFCLSCLVRRPPAFPGTKRACWPLHGNLAVREKHGAKSWSRICSPPRCPGNSSRLSDRDSVRARNPRRYLRARSQLTRPAQYFLYFPQRTCVTPCEPKLFTGETAAPVHNFKTLEAQHSSALTQSSGIQIADSPSSSLCPVVETKCCYSFLNLSA